MFYLFTADQQVLIEREAAKVARALAESIDSLAADGLPREVAASVVAETAMVSGWLYAATSIRELGIAPSRKRFVEKAAECCRLRGKVNGNEKDNRVPIDGDAAEFLRQLSATD